MIVQLMKESVDTVLWRILNFAHENEVIEFKDRKTLNKNEVGAYFSALSNEANLKMIDSAWLIFGISDDGHLSNSPFLNSIDSQNELKRYIDEQTSGNLTFQDIHERVIDGHRIVLLEIPPARNGTPTAFKGFAYERRGESLEPLSDDNRMRIMGESAPDWSAVVERHMGMEDLDPKAIDFARSAFIRNRPSMAAECREWSDEKFIDKMELRRNGQLTRAALILLGREESMNKMDDIPAGMRWILRDRDGTPLDSEVMGTPYLLSVERMCGKIRNVVYPMYEKGTIIRTNLRTYDETLLREAFYNCICHQDYTMSEFITLVEYERDRLVFSNAGGFMPGDVMSVIESDSPIGIYRNKLLARAMYRMGLVEIAGGGIGMMFRCQAARMFPMPIYETSGRHVTVTVIGRVTNPTYADILRANPGLRTNEIAALDAVAAGRQIPASYEERLISRGLIGRDEKGLYLLDPASRPKTRAPSLEEIRNEIIAALRTGPRDKQDLLRILKRGIMHDMDDNEAYVKLSNALSSLVKKGIIRNTGSSRMPMYELTAIDESP